MCLNSCEELRSVYGRQKVHFGSDRSDLIIPTAIKSYLVFDDHFSNDSFFQLTKIFVEKWFSFFQCFFTILFFVLFFKIYKDLIKFFSSICFQRVAVRNLGDFLCCVIMIFLFVFLIYFKLRFFFVWCFVFFFCFVFI